MHLTHLHVPTFDVTWMTPLTYRTISYHHSPFFVRDLYYQGCRCHSIAHLMCLFATSVRKWTRHLTYFPTSRFQTPDWQVECRTVLTEIYSHLCLSDMAVKTALIDTGPRPFCLQCSAPWGTLCDTTNAVSRGNLISDTHVHLAAGKLTSAEWLAPGARCGDLRNAVH